MQARGKSLNSFRLVFLITAFIYLGVGVISSFMGWKNYADTIWIVRVAERLPTLQPWSFLRTEVIAPPLGSSVNYPPLLFLVV